jgi:hypothetical protein
MHDETRNPLLHQEQDSLLAHTVDPEADSIVILNRESEVPQVVDVYGGEPPLQFHHHDPGFYVPKTSLVCHALIHRVVPLPYS